MGRKQEFKERRRKVAARNKTVAISVIVVAAVSIVAAVVGRNILGSGRGEVTPAATLASRPATNGTSMGDPAAPVKLDVWEDFQCSACLYFSQNEEPQIIERLVATGKVYYTFHMYPFIDGGEGESQDAANAAMCASEQGRFWDYHDTLFANWIGENAGAFTPLRLTAFAERIDLDMTAFNSCFQARKYADVIQKDFEAGKQRGVQSTPSIFVNDARVVSRQNVDYIPSIEEIVQAVAASGH